MTDQQSCWLKTIADADADETLKAAYDAVRREDGGVHNLYKAFGSWPAAMVSADAFYKTHLHGPNPRLDRWYLELIATQVAWLTECAYARAHHQADFERLLDNPKRAAAIIDAMEREVYEDALGPKHAAILRYTAKLTAMPQAMRQIDMNLVRKSGASDAEILEANQVCSAFAYWVRVINGLGIQLGGESVGAC